MAVWKDGKLVVNGQAMDAAKASRDMQKFLDAIDKVVKTHRNCMDTQSTVCDDVGTSAAETRTVTTTDDVLLESVWPGGRQLRGSCDLVEVVGLAAAPADRSLCKHGSHIECVDCSLCKWLFYLKC